MVSPYDLTVPGGVQGQVLGLGAALRSLGHEVVVVAPGRRVGRTDGLITVGEAIGVRANGSVAPVALSPLAAVRAGRAVRRGGFDVVHLHEPLAPVVNYGCLVAASQPIVGTFHRNGASAFYRILGPGVRWAVGRLAARCAVSEAARDNVAPFCAGEFEVLFNGIDVDRHRTEEPTPTEGPTVLFVGRHEPRKGLAVLLEAVSLMARPPVLWIAGAGPATAELRERFPASPRRQWLGTISEDEKVARMAGAHVFCAPSTGGESFGMVLLEAMAAGCAVVASDIDGYRQAAGGHARLVAPSDPQGLALALETALDDATSGAAGSSPDALASARRHAERWSMVELARRYEQIYRRVAPGGSGDRASAGPAVA
jgi:phosphatidylinositol alpha-mannosyltransferase